eukprot:scaffold237920_cov21-Tisochrysis_lutea.AAC.2
MNKGTCSRHTGLISAHVMLLGQKQPNACTYLPCFFPTASYDINAAILCTSLTSCLSQMNCDLSIQQWTVGAKVDHCMAGSNNASSCLVVRRMQALRDRLGLLMHFWLHEADEASDSDLVNLWILWAQTYVVLLRFQWKSHHQDGSLLYHVCLFAHLCTACLNCSRQKESVLCPSAADLAGLYRVWNPQFKSWSVFGQDQVAKVLLQWGSDPAGHNALMDAIKSIRLFNHYHLLR